MKRIWLATCLAAAVALPGFTLAAPAHASAVTVTSSSSFPITLTTVACGEPVQLSGEIHDLFHVTFDGAGGALLDYHFNPQDVSGTDLLTGAKYQGTGVTRQDLNFTPGGTFTTTFVNNFRLIGQATSPNFDVHENAHVTVNPNGTVTSIHDNFSITCH